MANQPQTDPAPTDPAPPVVTSPVPEVNPATVPHTTRSEVLLRVVEPFTTDFRLGDDVILTTPTVVANKTRANEILTAAEASGVAIEKVEV